ncbi:NADH-quinone oxidoreductase subunit N [Rubrolithibacter danxiaensis]|uniref:NADH-quinone oxidoreductase subunit N n=1 Tax=Rubrolithibacter danxiaensis TaxID=3390805 RepID=UPI003BF90517
MNSLLTDISQSLNNILAGISYFLPELVLIVSFLVVIVLDLFVKKKSNLLFSVVLLAVCITGYFSYNQLELVSKPVFLFNSSLSLDKLGVFFKLIFCFVSVLFVFFIDTSKRLQTHEKGIGDLYSILLAVQLGLHLMAMSSSLLMIYISIEMVSIGSYLMVGYVSGEKLQSEAAMKYVLFGSVCSAVMLYGISLIYAFTGGITIFEPQFIENLSKVPATSSGVAITLILIGIGFKLSFVPLHFWSPDVYQGAPTPVTAFLSTSPKIAGFAILIRFLMAFQSSEAAIDNLAFNFNIVLALVSFITMIVGNFSALLQNNVKRMLAYSSIGHTGFILMGLQNLSKPNLEAVLIYLFVYAVMNMAAFMLANDIEEQTGATEISQYQGLGKYMPLQFFSFILILISLTGLPPTGGFIAKFLVFSAALQQYNATASVIILILMITGAVTTLVSLFYYFKIPLNAYLRSVSSEISVSNSNLSYFAFVLAVFLIFIGIFPSFITNFISK